MEETPILKSENDKQLLISNSQLFLGLWLWKI
jgi:hypothetical protein